MTQPAPSPRSCPICGEPNRCTVALGQPAESCWCWSVKIDPDALERVPLEQREQACVCPKCAGIEGKLAGVSSRAT